MKTQSILQTFKDHILFLNGLKPKRPRQRLSEILRKPRKDSLKDRFAAYADGYPVRIMDGVSEMFPRLRSRLSEVEFERLVQDYIRQYPSKKQDLGQVGRNLPRFMKNYRQLENVAELCELARLEILASDLFHRMKSQKRFPFEHLKSANAFMEARWSFHPTTAIFQSRFNLLHEPTSGKIRRGFYFLLFRRHGLIEISMIQANEYGILKGLLKGKSLHDLDLSDEDMLKLPSMAESWAKRDLFSGIRY